jgi:hypothetical protein
MGLRKHTILLHVEGKHFYTWPQLWSSVVGFRMDLRIETSSLP